MREIKFRAWDKSLKKMWIDFKCYLLIDIVDGKPFNTVEDEYQKDRYILMQYTGLKDKSGREIFEGDVMQRISRENDSISGRIFQVVWVDCTARFAIVAIDCKKYGSAEWTIDPLFYEVIGNIYESNIEELCQ